MHVYFKSSKCLNLLDRQYLKTSFSDLRDASVLLNYQANSSKLNNIMGTQK